MKQAKAVNGVGPLPTQGFPDTVALDDFLSRPDQALQADLASLDGDILVLGASGKMGPTLARLAQRAAPDKQVVAVSRFSDASARERLETWGIKTIACDLLDRDAIAALPRIKNVIAMTGRKFGSAGAESATWANNAIVSAQIAESFADSRLVMLSTGCVYPFVPVTGKGADESTPPGPPPGEYAWSCVGRERLFEHLSQQRNTAGRLIRLNYAIDMRYGVLHDIARAVWEERPVDVSTGHVNVIWQGDANALILRALAHCTSPVTALNVTGPETLSVRALAGQFGQLLGKSVRFSGQEAETAWLSDASAAAALFGEPTVPLASMLAWTADWVSRGGESHGKPTHFEARDGQY
jgi:nucleoside-diphosphate-sugar epimerase